jgi:hypothetical protein
MTPDTSRPGVLFSKEEAEVLSRVREQYEAEGYEVFSGLPIEEDDPLSAYRPGLVLGKGADVVVIELCGCDYVPVDRHRSSASHLLWQIRGASGERGNCHLDAASAV